ncbi:hypothetical protein [Demequina globuliformis]|uniref:hypothetical protein n=1 Tax=Demequina globuliformis TaxID=676202 RepID=UPI0007807457|nr:hypothetical protein [Demequina globuliformis]
MSEEASKPDSVERKIWIGVGVVASVVVAFVVWMLASISSDNDYKAEAQAACEADVLAKYHGDEDVWVFSELEGRDGDRLEFTVHDSIPEFEWTCFASPGDDGEIVVDSFK